MRFSTDIYASRSMWQSTSSSFLYDRRKMFETSSQRFFSRNMDHPIYRRRPIDNFHPWFESVLRQYRTGEYAIIVDNTWIVPYNAFLLKKYQMHINVEMCNTAMASKYLFKYITKGPDRAMAKIQKDDDQQRNEIEEYEDLRSVGATEACWRIFGFQTNKVHPSVQALPIHLENGQQIPFEEGQEEVIVQEGAPEMELTMWFHYNRTKDPLEQNQLYPNFPQFYVWNKSSKVWTKQKRIQTLKTIGQVHNVHPLMGELYYLRLLLHNNHSLGACDFSNLKTLPTGITVCTYREVCL